MCLCSTTVSTDAVAVIVATHNTNTTDVYNWRLLQASLVPRSDYTHWFDIYMCGQYGAI